MNKDQYRLHVYNNRYVRGVIVTICKIIIWSLIYALFIGIVSSVMSADLNALTNNALNYYAPSLSAGSVFALLVFVVVTIAYYWAVISEIIRKIKQNKQLTQYEDDYLNNSSKSSKE